MLVLCFVPCAYLHACFPVYLIGSTDSHELFLRPGAAGSAGQGLCPGLLGRPGGSQPSFISWTHARFQICLKGKGNFLLTAYSISKHLEKAPFSSFITGHHKDGRNETFLGIYKSRVLTGILLFPLEINVMRNVLQTR